MVFGNWIIPIPILFIRIFLSSTKGLEGLGALNGEPYSIL